MCVCLRQVYSLPPSLSYPFKHEPMCLLNHPPHTVLQLNVVLAKNVLVHSLLSPSLYIFCSHPLVIPLSLSLSLSLSCCHITIWLPSGAEWSVFMAECLQTVADTLAAPLRNHREAVRSLCSEATHTHTHTHTRPNQRWMCCLGRRSCLRACLPTRTHTYTF